MRPGMQCLLDLLRGGPINLASDDPAWEQMLELAEEEHLLPWAARLCAPHVYTSPRLSSRIKAIEREVAIAAFYWGAELGRILRAFANHSLVVVPLKGPFLAERLYGGGALRVSYDLDLLVAKRDVAQAESVLSSLGFMPGEPDDYHRQWYKGPTTVELHHDVENPLAFDFQIARVLQRAQPAECGGQPCWQLSPGDELLFLCLHGVRHRFERLSLIVDLCLAFQKLRVTDVSGAGPSMAERTTLLVLGLAMANRLQPGLEAGFAVPASPAQRKHLEGVAERIWQRLLTQRSEPLDWQTLHAFYVEMELPGRRLRRRSRHLRILLHRLIPPDYTYAARFGMHRQWQIRLLRPFRIVSEAVSNASRLQKQAQ